MEHAISNRSLRGTDALRWALLALPIYGYLATTWFVRPLSVSNIALAYAVPLLFATGLLLCDVPRSELAALLRRVRLELALCLVMGLLSILSLVNSSEPIRVLRILFPAALPVLLFFQLAALRSVSPKTVESLPRHFVMAGFAFASVPLFMASASAGLHDYLFDGGYRFVGFFDHESQTSVMVAVMVPLIIGEIAVSERRAPRWLWIALLLITFYTLTRVGSKTAMAITFGYAWLFYIIAHLRFQSYLKNVLLISIVVVLMIFASLYGISITTAIDPILGEKITQIFDQGVENYSSIQSRSELWAEALNQGKQHWLIGTGAGETILGVTHAHNLVLDYFRGIGFFGAVAIVLLCGCILWRAVKKTFEVLLSKTVHPEDMRALACYAAAAVYVLCNQLSNSFGPATISALWMIYLPAVMSEPAPQRALRRA